MCAYVQNARGQLTVIEHINEGIFPINQYFLENLLIPRSKVDGVTIVENLVWTLPSNANATYKP